MSRRLTVAIKTLRAAENTKTVLLKEDSAAIFLLTRLNLKKSFAIFLGRLAVPSSQG